MYKLAWPASFVAVALILASALREPAPAPASDVRIVAATPVIVRELRALSRLETLQVHVEKVVDATDHQVRMYGMVEAADRVLLVAVGEVTLGVDLGKLAEDAMSYDAATGVAHLRLPAPEVLATRIDEDRSYVHARTTDLLAVPNPGLEAAARRDAVARFAEVGRDPRHLDSARVNAEHQLSALATAWGVRDLVVTWEPPDGS